MPPFLTSQQKKDKIRAILMPQYQPSLALPLFRIVKEFVSKSFLSVLQMGKKIKGEYTLNQPGENSSPEMGDDLAIQNPQKNNKGEPKKLSGRYILSWKDFNEQDQGDRSDPKPSDLDDKSPLNKPKSTKRQAIDEVQQMSKPRKLIKTEMVQQIVEGQSCCSNPLEITPFDWSQIRQKSLEMLFKGSKEEEGPKRRNQREPYKLEADYKDYACDVYKSISKNLKQSSQKRFAVHEIKKPLKKKIHLEDHNTPLYNVQKIDEILQSERKARILREQEKQKERRRRLKEQEQAERIAREKIQEQARIAESQRLKLESLQKQSLLSQNNKLEVDQQSKIIMPESDKIDQKVETPTRVKQPIELHSFAKQNSEIVEKKYQPQLPKLGAVAEQSPSKKQSQKVQEAKISTFLSPTKNFSGNPFANNNSAKGLNFSDLIKQPRDVPNFGQLEPSPNKNVFSNLGGQNLFVNPQPSKILAASPIKIDEEISQNQLLSQNLPTQRVSNYSNISNVQVMPQISLFSNPNNVLSPAAFNSPPYTFSQPNNHFNFTTGVNPLNSQGDNPFLKPQSSTVQHPSLFGQSPSAHQSSSSSSQRSAKEKKNPIRIG